MNRREKLLYHQIHPIKLAVDISSSLISSWMLWKRQPGLGLAIGLVPSIVVTLVMLRWMDFTGQRHSPFGRYVAYHMTRTAEVVRMTGQISIWIAAWHHVSWAIACGIALIIFGWTYSLPKWLSNHSNEH